MLTPQQTNRLNELEAKIHLHLTTVVEKQNSIFLHFRETGLALAEIREKKLWADKAQSWPEYCQDEYGFNNDRASQIISAALELRDFTAQLSRIREEAAHDAELQDAADDIRNGGAAILPQNERQLRALLRVPKHLRINVWLAACAMANNSPHLMTAAIIEKAANGISPNNVANAPASIVANVEAKTQAQILKLFAGLSESMQIETIEKLTKIYEANP